MGPSGRVTETELEGLRACSRWYAVGDERGLVALFVREEDAKNYCEERQQGLVVV